MGYLSLTILTSLALLVAYSNLIRVAEAKISSDAGTQATNDLLQKRPAVWLKQFPIRRFKSGNAYSVYRRDFQPSDVEFSDDVVNDIEKRFDDYGHMR